MSVKKSIAKDELISAFRDISDFQIGEEHEWGISIGYKPNPDEHIIFINSELQATSPSDELYKKLELLAKKLNAVLVYEDEVSTCPTTNSVKSREIVLFWPVLSIILLVLLIWKW